MESVPEQPKSWWRKRNWWKIGFFLLLIAFEIAREAAVLASEDRPKLLVSKAVLGSGDYITAQGRWRRTDGGDPLTPSLTRIDCDRAQGTCRVIEVIIHDDYVWPPDVDEFEAQFVADGARYSWEAGCVRYDVRLDTSTSQATSVRSILPPSEQNSASGCQSVLDDRIEMVLSDGTSSELGDFKLPRDQFLPIARFVSWINENEP